jgi:prepilin-type N-terminal cleavage/methylation domain-containing protein
MRRTDRAGFTFIELLMAVTLIGISFFPIMELFTTAMSEFQATSEHSTALSLAREGMERLRNLDLPVERIAAQGSSVFPPENEPPLSLNHREWRVKTIVHPETSPLRVDIEVVQEGGQGKPLVFSTLLEDLI